MNELDEATVAQLTEQYANYAEFDDDDEDAEFDDDDEDAEFDDDDEDAEFDDDDEGMAAEGDAEFLGALLDPIGAIARGVFGGGRKKSRRRVRTAQPRRSYTRGVRGRSQATVRTPYGAMQLQFTRKFVTKADLGRALARVRSDIRRNAAAIKKVNRSAAAATRQIRALAAAQRKKNKEIDKKLEDAKQSMLLPLLLGPKEPKALKLDAGQTTVDKLVVTDVEYDNNSSNLLPLLLMGDSAGGMDPIMLLALTGGL